MSAKAGLPFMSATVSWDEDVLLADGHLLSVRRTVTYGPDEWGRSGRGRLKEQTIRFTHDGNKVVWENNDVWPIVYMPEIVDFAGGKPVLVMPVHRWGPCNKYDFPSEGLVAFGYQKGSWDRIAIAELPKVLKVNLLRSTHAIQYWKEYKDKRITPLDKQELERSGWGATKQGQSIPEASKFYASYEDSCVRMRPPLDRQLDAARQRNSDAERNAVAIQAKFLAVDATQEVVTPETFSRDRGAWTGVGYLSPSCRGIVDRVEAARQWSGNESGYRSQLIGYELIVSTATNGKRKIPISEPGIAQMQTVVCDEKAILAIRRNGKANLIIHRFSHGGDLLGAYRVNLPDAPNFRDGANWAELWTVVPDSKGDLTITIADYSYPRTANLGGTIRQKAMYEARLLTK